MKRPNSRGIGRQRGYETLSMDVKIYKKEQLSDKRE